MNIESAEAWHGPDNLRQHAEGYDHLQIGMISSQLLDKGGIFHFYRLQDRDALLCCIAFDLRGLKVILVPSDGLVRLRDHSHDIVSILY